MHQREGRECYYLEDPFEEMEGKCGFEEKKPEIIRRYEEERSSRG